jgi:hypothetical protein
MTVSNQGVVMKLLSLTKRVTGLLQIAKLYTVFGVFDSAASAMHGFVRVAELVSLQPDEEAGTPR